jgi:hypothetical protein
VGGGTNSFVHGIQRSLGHAKRRWASEDKEEENSFNLDGIFGKSAVKNQCYYWCRQTPFLNPVLLTPSHHNAVSYATSIHAAFISSISNYLILITPSNSPNPSLRSGAMKALLVRTQIANRTALAHLLPTASATMRFTIHINIHHHIDVHCIPARIYRGVERRITIFTVGSLEECIHRGSCRWCIR